MKPGTSDDRHTRVARARPWWTTQPGGRGAPPGGDTPAHGARRPRSRLVLGVLVLAAVVSTRWLRINVSPSVPLGLYRLAPVPAPLVRGTLVLLPVPASVRSWHSAWLPLLKPVAAVAGETVCVEEGSLRIGAVDYGRAYAEAQGRPLPHLDGCLSVQPGEVFLAGRVEQSLDSRYFGPVRVADLTAHAVPLLTWRSRGTPVIVRPRWPR